MAQASVDTTQGTDEARVAPPDPAAARGPDAEQLRAAAASLQPEKATEPAPAPAAAAPSPLAPAPAASPGAKGAAALAPGVVERLRHLVARREPSNDVCDEDFIAHLKRLKELHTFLMQQAIDVSGSDSPNALPLENLYPLRFNVDGRSPTDAEWGEVIRRTQAMFKLLSEPLRRRFLMGDIPKWVPRLPIALAIAAFASLVLAVFADRFADAYKLTIGVVTLPFYVLWLASLGAIGAVAFIGMNALSVQQDITFDMNNRRLMLLRIVIGAMFGLVLTLPIGFSGFLVFVQSITDATVESSGAASRLAPNVGIQATLLLMPFILGFSTSLVIMILNRLIDGVQAFFGKQEKPAEAGALEAKGGAAGGGAR